MPSTDTVRCSWVPGTLNRVRVQKEGRNYEVSLERLERAVGRPATFDLYLKGYIHLTLERDKVDSLVA